MVSLLMCPCTVRYMSVQFNVKQCNIDIDIEYRVMYYPQITTEIFWTMEHLQSYLITRSSLIAYHLPSNRNLAVNIAFRLTFYRTSRIYLSERPCLNAVNSWPLVDVDYACCIDNFFAETGNHEVFIYISMACYKMIQQR